MLLLQFSRALATHSDIDFTNQTLLMFSSEVESSIKHLCNITNRALDDTENFNITEFGEKIMKLILQDQEIKDTIMLVKALLALISK